MDDLNAYAEAARRNELKRVPVPLIARDIAERPGRWRKLAIAAFSMTSAGAPPDQPLEIEGLAVRPREPVIDELTRHHETEQAFFSVNFPIAVIAAPSDPADPDMPDSKRIDLIPCDPGEVVVLDRGVWHSLPFSFSGTAICLTIVHRLPPDRYHDVRDLPAHGWYGEVQWPRQ